MNEKEIISLGSQITRCYSENKNARYRAHLCVSSWGGILKERFETVLSSSHLGWRGVRFEAGDFVEAGRILHNVMRGEESGKLLGALKSEDDVQRVVEGEDSAEISAEAATVAEVKTNGQQEDTQKNTTAQQMVDTTATAANETATTTSLKPSDTPPSIVYLSSDSPNTLTSLLPHASYIIGGIVDKNRHKGLCYARAQALGIPTAKLPIGEYMTMNSRTVLTVNHVVEIMLRWLEEGDWGIAFDRVIPKRKGGVLKGKDIKNGSKIEQEDHDKDDADSEVDLDVDVEEPVLKEEGIATMGEKTGLKHDANGKKHTGAADYIALDADSAGDDNTEEQGGVSLESAEQ